MESVKTSFLLFSLRDALMAVETIVVREILWLPELTPLEEIPFYIPGVFNLRGRVVPVMDLHLRWGRKYQKYKIADRVIVMETAGFLMGIIVNDVHDVVNISTEEMEPSPFSNRDIEPHPHFISAVGKWGEEIVMVLNHENFFKESMITAENLDGNVQPQPGETIGVTYFCPEALPKERKVFHERARNLLRSAADDDSIGLMPVAVVSLSGEYFGVELKVVREFSLIHNLKPIPCCPGHVVGNMNLRGNILTLVDIRGVLSMPLLKVSPSYKVIVVSMEKVLLTGVVVDDVLDVINLMPSEMKSVTSAGQTGREKYVKGAAPYGGRMMAILDLHQLLIKSDLIVNQEV